MSLAFLCLLEWKCLAPQQVLSINAYYNLINAYNLSKSPVFFGPSWNTRITFFSKKKHVCLQREVRAHHKRPREAHVLLSVSHHSTENLNICITFAFLHSTGHNHGTQCTVHNHMDVIYKKVVREVHCSRTLVCLFFVSVLLHNAIPFVGFGFLDNAIMIAAVSGMSLSSGSVRLEFHELQEKELIVGFTQLWEGTDPGSGISTLHYSYRDVMD